MHFLTNLIKLYITMGKHELESKTSEYPRNWIIEKSVEITDQYDNGVPTIRGIHYDLFGLGMPNTQENYKRVISGLTKARRNGLIAFEKFSDHDRQVHGETAASETTVENAVSDAKYVIEALMTRYDKNRWENQPMYIEVWIEKKTMIGTFLPICQKWDAALCPCKGYPSLTYLKEASDRFKAAISRGQSPKILYFGDYDPSGVNIPIKIKSSLLEDFKTDIALESVVLSKEQVLAWNLPQAPCKTTDSRTAKFLENGGIGQTEIDAIDTAQLRQICNDSIKFEFSQVAYKDLLRIEAIEKAEYIAEMEKYIDFK